MHARRHQEESRPGQEQEALGAQGDPRGEREGEVPVTHRLLDGHGGRGGGDDA